jgi:hypothetical protein
MTDFSVDIHHDATCFRLGFPLRNTSPTQTRKPAQIAIYAESVQVIQATASVHRNQ